VSYSAPWKGAVTLADESPAWGVAGGPSSYPGVEKSYRPADCSVPLHCCRVRNAMALVAYRSEAVMKSLGRNNDVGQPLGADRRDCRVMSVAAFHGGPPCFTLERHMWAQLPCKTSGTVTA
jgi:hypothetical protein